MTARLDTLDVRALRTDFPALERVLPNGRRLVYLDNAATTQKPRAVIEAMRRHYEEGSANVHRALHQLAVEATHQFEGAREKIAHFIQVPSSRNIVFTRGATEGINLVAYGWARKFLQAGDEVLVTEMEHHSNLIPWQQVTRERGAVLKSVPVCDDGTLDRAALERLLTPRVKLLAVTHASNVLGTVNPVAELARLAHANGTLVLVDAAQSAPHLLLDVRIQDMDFCVFSGHKMLGPTGIGVLYAREALLEAMEPMLTGGEMISRVFADHATWADIPHKFEAGTPPVAEVIGLGAAVDYLAQCDREALLRHERELVACALERLCEIPGVRIYGQAPERVGAISFALEGIHPHDLAQHLDQAGIAIRAGHLCAQPLMRRFNVPALNRASFYYYNDTDEVEQLATGVMAARSYFHGTR